MINKISFKKIIQNISKTRKAWIIENVISFGSTLLIVFMIQSSIIQAFKIPSGSMIPTLFVGDYIFVNKFAYGLKMPFSDLITDRPIYLIKGGLPEHADVIVFIYPKDESLYYIKRVIGVPGDQIEMRDKVLYINQKMVSQDLFSESQEENLFQTLDDSQYPRTRMKLFTEHLDQVDHAIMTDQSRYRNENFGPIRVPPESLFVMGDNRDYSADSRYWGFVPMKNVKGKAIIIWMSFLLNFSDSGIKLRSERIGTVIK